MTQPVQQWNGVYPATVYNTADPLGQYRIQLLVPQVLGNAVSQWATPVGLVTPSPVPAVGTAVHAVFFGGDVSHPGYVPPVQTPTLFASYDAEVAQDTPVAWWKLNEAVGASTVLDYSGNGYTGTPSHVTFGETDAITGNTSASFGGTDSRIVTTYTAPAMTAFSVELWVNLASVTPTASAQLVGTANTFSGGSDNYDGFSINLDGSGYTPSILLGNGSAAAAGGLGDDLPADGWVYLAATWNGAILTCFQNGVTTSTTDFTGTLGAGVYPTTIGAKLDDLGEWFSGLLAEIAIYDTALPVNRVLAHYDARTGADAITAASVAASTVTATTVDATEVDTPSVVGTGTLDLSSGTANGTDVATVLTLPSKANGGFAQVTDGKDGATYILGVRTVRTGGTQTVENDIQNIIPGLEFTDVGPGDYVLEAWIDLVADSSTYLGYLTYNGSATVSGMRAFITTIGNGQPTTYKVQTTFGTNTNVDFALNSGTGYICVLRGHMTVTAAGTVGVYGATSGGDGFTTQPRCVFRLWPDAA
jgi:hypothetical protein